MASTAQFKRYLWLVDVIYSAGEITRDEINRRWANSVCNESKESVYPERTFHRHREDIAQLFGIEIECSKTAGNVYRIANKERMKERQSWVLENFAINNLVNFDRSLGARLIFEDIPEGNRYLGTIATAMQEGKKLYVSYQKFGTDAHSFLLEPYCLKVFHQRWYLVGKSDAHPDEVDPRVYSLDRVKNLALTDQPFRFPKAFDANEFFENYFGVDRTAEYKPQRIVIRVGTKDANYLRTLHLHHSQREEQESEDSFLFSYFIAPTYDFVQELRKFGPGLEIVAPAELRERFAEDARLYSKLYS